MLRIKPFDNSQGKIILSSYELAYLRNFEDPQTGYSIIDDSSQFNWLFEGLLNEAGLQNEIEIIGNKGEKIYNIKAIGQRLLLNEYTEGSQDRTIMLNDCGYQSVGEFVLPAKGVLLVNTKVIVTNAHKIGSNEPAIPSNAHVVKEGPDNYVIAEFNEPVSCNPIVKYNKDKSFFGKIFSYPALSHSAQVKI